MNRFLLLVLLGWVPLSQAADFEVCIARTASKISGETVSWMPSVYYVLVTNKKTQEKYNWRLLAPETPDEIDFLGPNTALENSERTVFSGYGLWKTVGGGRLSKDYRLILRVERFSLTNPDRASYDANIDINASLGLKPFSLTKVTLPKRPSLNDVVPLYCGSVPLQ